MMRGLLHKIFLEVRWPVVLLSIGLFIIMSMLTWVLPKVLGDIDQMFERLPFLKPLITALIGVDPGDNLSAAMMQAFLWVHPTVLATTWAHALMYSTRVPAGEIDRGTVDFFLGLPISRWQIVRTEILGCAVSGLVIVSIGCCGHMLTGHLVADAIQPAFGDVLMILCNLYALYLAVAGGAFLISASSDRRTRAIGIGFAILLASFLLNFLVQFWEPAKSVAFLSVMEYYRPASVLQDGVFPWRNVGILLGLAVVGFTAGGVVFRRRSICTV